MNSFYRQSELVPQKRLISRFFKKYTENPRSLKKLIGSEISNNKKTRNHLQFSRICKSAKRLRNHVFHKLSNFYKFSNVHFPLDKSFTQVIF